MQKQTKSFDTLLSDQLAQNGYTLEEFLKGYKFQHSRDWKRGYASAHGIMYGTYIETQIDNYIHTLLH